MKKVHFKRKLVFVIAVTVITILLTATATAAGAGGGGAINTTEFFSVMSTALQVVLGLTGAGVAVMGVIALVEAQSSQDHSIGNRAVSFVLFSVIGKVGIIALPFFFQASMF
ncbi:MAG: hypothetical protein FWF76_01380 [Oscillospiraceae bacterium]|nr:hypothetical protein [Oscillospiraceae bacterium]